MSQIFTIENDRVVIKKLTLSETTGAVLHEGDVSISGTLTVDNLVVKNQEQTAQAPANFGHWQANNEVDIVGQGFSWTWGMGSVRLTYESGNKLGTDGDFNIGSGKSYMIDGITVLNANELAPQITKSRLKELGPLKGLRVQGDAILGDFIYANSNSQRFGVGTNEPNGVLSVVQSDLELVVTFDNRGTAQIGSYTNTDVELITDNTARITLKKSGEVVFGNEITKNANVKINGTLTVDTVVSDNRIDRYSPLEFKASRERDIYGQGLVWNGNGGMRQFIMRADPDRLWTTESIELNEGKGFYINGEAVLSSHSLGNNVKFSSLAKLGTLEELNVAGEATFMSRVNASRAVINAKVIEFNDGDEFTISNSQLSGSKKISFAVAGDETFYSDLNEIAIGNKQNVSRPVKVFGTLSVGINSPEQDVDLAVKGNVSFGGKKFITGHAAPIQGNYNKGDVCWNTEPGPGNYIGWICVETGGPGRWLPFGSIASQ